MSDDLAYGRNCRLGDDGMLRAVAIGFHAANKPHAMEIVHADEVRRVRCKQYLCLACHTGNCTGCEMGENASEMALFRGMLEELRLFYRENQTGQAGFDRFVWQLAFQMCVVLLFLLARDRQCKVLTGARYRSSSSATVVVGSGASMSSISPHCRSTAAFA
jgi:hypothetical protein